MSILSDIKGIQAKVRESMQNGPVTPYYTLPLDQVYELLNAALASEIICVLRYKQHYYMTTSIHQEQLQGLFKEHWQDEEIHLERIADRIKPVSYTHLDVYKRQYQPRAYRPTDHEGNQAGRRPFPARRTSE